MFFTGGESSLAVWQVQQAAVCSSTARRPQAAAAGGKKAQSSSSARRSSSSNLPASLCCSVQAEHCTALTTTLLLLPAALTCWQANAAKFANSYLEEMVGELNVNDQRARRVATSIFATESFCTYINIQSASCNLNYHKSEELTSAAAALTKRRSQIAKV